MGCRIGLFKKLKEFKNSKDSSELERAKILFQYSSVSIFALLMGFFLFQYTPSLFFFEQAEQHFALPFFYCTTISEIFYELCCHCAKDFIFLWGIFFFTFSRFPYLFSNLVLFYQGLSCGFLIATLFGISQLPYRQEMFLLLLLRSLLLLSFFFYTYKIAICSEKIQSSPKRLGRKIFFTVIISGMMISSHVIYCGLIYLI